MFLFFIVVFLFLRLFNVGLQFINLSIALVVDYERYYTRNTAHSSLLYDIRVDLISPFIIYMASGMRLTQIVLHETNRVLLSLGQEVYLLLISGETRIGLLGIFLQPVVWLIG